MFFSNRPGKAKIIGLFKIRRELIIWLVIAVCLFPSHSVRAYIDPGTGSYIIQVVIGLFFGVAYATKNYWRHIIYRIRNRKNKK
ncbi:MAG: hypothetical protein ABIH38_00175 [Patescibacteria group bacterium]